MAVRVFRVAVVVLCGVWLFCPPVLAAGCKIGIIAELPVTMNGMRPMITAKINGEDARFILDSGAFFSLITRPAAAQYELQTEPAPFNLMLQGVGGSSRAMVTTVKELTLAGIPIRKVQFVVGGSAVGPGTAGLLGQNVPALVTRAGMSLARFEQGGSRGNNSDVLADLNKASATAAKEDDVHFEIGTLYSRAGAFGLAIEQYDLWLDKHPPAARTPEAYAYRCRSRAMLGLELDKALSDCNRAVKAREDAPFFLDSRGLVYLRMGRYEKAIADYDAVLQTQPKNPWALYGRGLAKLHKGQSADGQADIAAAKAAGPRIVAEAMRRGLTPP